MKKLIFIWLSLVVSSFQIHVCFANKIDLLKVVNANIEQYKANAMNQQQNTRSRSIDEKNKRLAANKNIAHKILFHIKSNKNLLLALAATATSLWGVRFLLKKMPTTNNDASSLNNNEGLFKFEEDNVGVYQQPQIIDEQEKNSPNNSQESSESPESLNQSDNQTTDDEKNPNTNIGLNTDSSQAEEAEVYREETNGEKLAGIGIIMVTIALGLLKPVSEILLGQGFLSFTIPSEVPSVGLDTSFQ